MKRWTQAELDEQKSDLAGVLDLGTGDFRECQFYGRHRVHIGPNSMIGDGVRLGENCRLGEGCQIGDRFMSGDFLEIGEHCHFGKKAQIGFASKIGAGSCLASDCRIMRETIICEGVRLPENCEVYGVKGVNGRSYLRIGPIVGRTVMAFRATDEDGRRAVYVSCTGVEIRELSEFARYVRARAQKPGADATWTGMALAAGYIAEHYANAPA